MSLFLSIKLLFLKCGVSSDLLLITLFVASSFGVELPVFTSVILHSSMFSPVALFHIFMVLLVEFILCSNLFYL